jgi:hypothetical protein
VAAPSAKGDTLQATMMEAAQAVTRAMGTPEAAGNPQLQQTLAKLQQVTIGISHSGGAMPQQGQPPGPPGAPSPGAGMGPPGGGAANPAMGTPTGGGMGPTPPGAGASMGIPQPNPDELRRLIASQTG